MIYPYRLNDSVKYLGNISKKGMENNLLVWSLFNSQEIMFLQRKHGTTWTDLERELKNLVSS